MTLPNTYAFRINFFSFRFFHEKFLFDSCGKVPKDFYNINLKTVSLIKAEESSAILIVWTIFLSFYCTI